MVIVIKKGSPEQQVNTLISWIESQGLRVHVSNGEYSTIIGLIGDTNRIDADLIEGLEIVETIKKIVYSKKARETMEDYVLDQTQTFEITITKEPSICEILNTAYFAMKEKGYDPINQLIGYIVTGDSGFITNHKNARNLICNSDRDDLLRVVLSKYFVC